MHDDAPTRTSAEIAAIASGAAAVSDPARERAVAAALASLDLADPRSVERFGEAAQDRIAAFIDDIVSRVRVMDAPSAAADIGGVLSQARGLDPSSLGRFSLTRLFKGAHAQVTDFVARYDTVEGQVEKAKSLMLSRLGGIESRADQMDDLYRLNYEQFLELEALIEAGRQRLARARAEDLPSAECGAAGGGHAEGERLEAVRRAVTLLDERIFDLEAGRADCIQAAQRIRLIQENARLVARTIRKVVRRTIPDWKQQFVTALALHEQREATALAASLNDASNRIRRENAANLRLAAVEAAKEASRPAIDVETLRVVHDELIATLDGLTRVSADGERALDDGRRALSSMEADLKARLAAPR